MKDLPELNSLYRLEQQLVADQDPTEAGHEYLRQIFASDRDFRAQTATLAIESYANYGPGVLVQIWDNLYEGWPTPCNNPDCIVIHDAPPWPQEFPELENDDAIYITQANIAPDCDFEVQLLEKISTYNPDQEFVVAFLDRIQGKGGMGTIEIPKNIKPYKGFDRGQSQPKRKRKRKKKS